MDMGHPRSFVERVGLLRELDLFSGLAEADLDAIGHATTMIHCRPGDRVLAPDDHPDRISIVKRGRVRVYRLNADGRQLTLDIYERGTVLGDMRLLGQDRIPEAYAEAIDDALICRITSDEVRRLIERYPVIGVNIIGYLSHRLQAAELELASMAYDRVDQRLARKLGDLSRRFGITTPDGTLIDARLTQQELAEMIGTTRETLAHTLSEFRSQGLLDVARHRVLIRNAERLAELAEGRTTADS
jgi:CRP/FNR family cyclic AMP-dependent transcriptional regulator